MMSSTPVFGAALAFVVWRIYRRVRRSIGRQPLRPRRAMVSVSILGLFSAIIIAVSLSQPRLLWGMGGGLALGLVLGWIGLRLTQFETTAAGHFYTPNTLIGVILSALLVGRIAYRFMIMHDVAVASHHPPPMQSPLTFFIFGLTAGYYIVYQTGLFMHSRDKNVSDQKSF